MTGNGSRYSRDRRSVLAIRQRKSGSSAIGVCFLAITHSVLILVSPLLVPSSHASDSAPTSSQSITSETLDDGVVVYRRNEPANARPHFYELMQSIYGGSIDKNQQLPSGKSVAFLVGVSEYEDPAFTDLEFVENDLRAMKDYLLSQGGFDEVYVAKNKVATAPLVQDYMSNKFRTLLKSNDRLLFYFSGHGMDYSGGNMALVGARPNDYVKDMIKVREINDWSRINQNKHILFIIDCCASGLNTPKWASRDDRTQIVNSLDGNGSRIVLTAGSGIQKTYNIAAGHSQDRFSLFTYSLVTTLNRLSSLTYTGIANIEQVYLAATLFADQLARENDIPGIVTPQINHLQEDTYTGTFLFLADTAETVPDIPIMQQWFEHSDKIRIFVKASPLARIFMDNEAVEPNSYVTVAPGQHEVTILSKGQPVDHRTVTVVSNSSVLDLSAGMTTSIPSYARVRYGLSEVTPENVRRCPISFTLNGFVENVGMYTGPDSLIPGDYELGINVEQGIYQSTVSIDSVFHNGKAIAFESGVANVTLESGQNKFMLSLRVTQNTYGSDK